MKIIVWYNEKKNEYYCKEVHDFTLKKYYVGYRNQYEHEVVLIIENILLKINKMKLKNRILTKLISFLEKLNK